ncbi:MAG: class I SAM-dependent methyltransferase [Clostridia bacterium]|nr:class I SAM-dependent methyltransferase [Clostridia bacterium]
MENKTEKIRKRYNRAAGFFDMTEKMMEGGKMGEWRKMIWEEAKGKVLEVGVGTGKNIQYYPKDAEIIAIDFSEKMLERARHKVEKLGRKVDLRLMDVQKLDFPDETFDTVMTTCVFCSVPDPVKGLGEIRRVCKKDGKIIMLEHVRSKKPFIGFFMDILNPVVVRIVGANINRNTVDNLEKAGLTVELETNLMMDIVKHLKCSRDGTGKVT